MPENIAHEGVDSSNIDSLGHCNQTNRMVVYFKSGGRYVYHNVTPDTFDLIKNSDSVGTALHKHIKKTGHKYTQF